MALLAAAFISKFADTPVQGVRSDVRADFDQAAFWKKVATSDGARWLIARVADDAALARLLLR